MVAFLRYLSALYLIICFGFLTGYTTVCITHHRNPVGVFLASRHRAVPQAGIPELKPYEEGKDSNNAAMAIYTIDDEAASRAVREPSYR